MITELLPEWAERKSNGNFMEVGAQLRTKDGRRCGNAIVYALAGSRGEIAIVITDAGNEMRLMESEFDERFYSPIYIMEEWRVRLYRAHNGRY